MSLCRADTNRLIGLGLVRNAIGGVTAAGVLWLLPLLPARASESLGYIPADSLTVDSSVAESPEILDTLLIVVVTYFSVMLLYLWLSSFLDKDLDEGPSESSSNNQQAPTDQGELPPGYGSFLNANVRSYVDPHGRGHRQVHALQELGQAAPLEGEDLPALKDRLAAGAAEALEQQLIHQHRAAVEGLIDQHLDQLLPAGGGQFHEELIVRQALLVTSGKEHMLLDPKLQPQQSTHHGWALTPSRRFIASFTGRCAGVQVMRRLVGPLVAEEAMLLLEGVERGRQALEATGRLVGSDNRRWWALW
eukprot:gene7939-8135_t